MKELELKMENMFWIEEKRENSKKNKGTIHLLNQSSVCLGKYFSDN